jgi:hypothetical protein
VRRGVVSCLTSKCLKFSYNEARLWTSSEKFALQGVAYGTIVTTDMSEKDKSELVGNMFNLFVMSIIWICLFSCLQWDFGG